VERGVADINAVINQLIDYDIKQATQPEERVYLERLKVSSDELLRLFYARKVAAVQLAARQGSVQDDRAIKMGIVSSANVAKLALVGQLEGVMGHIDARIKALSAHSD
jgi:hypothetical protein